MTPLQGCLLFSALLFATGFAGAVTRRHAILVLIGIELMLNAANLTFVTFARMYSTMNTTSVYNGQIFVFFVMTVAAAEVAVGLALVVAIFRNKQSIDIDQLNSLKG